VRVTLNVNGHTHVLDDVEPWVSLLFVLRERLGLYAAKNACEQGECGSCTVLADGNAVCGCLMMATQAQGREVVTLEGLAEDRVARTVQRCMVEGGGVQCGFCTPGFVVTATELLHRRPDAAPAEVREALSGNLCRCTGYRKILGALSEAQTALLAPAGEMSANDGTPGASR
jgi:aerobic carbon-monoxide dehydrogenase small subunit